MNDTGINTADITSVMAMMAPPISPMAASVASMALRCSSCILACTASTTTMALSTTMPMASTSANSVSRLMLKPIICMKNSVPTSATGTASAGISVERQSCKNRNTITNTSKNASTSVRSTS